MNIKKLSEVCMYLQRNDKNGEYLQMIDEYNNNELDINVIYEVCNRVLNEWKEDLESISSPTQSDLEDIEQLKQLIAYINE